MKQTRLLEIIREEIASALGEAATTYAGKTSIDDLKKDKAFGGLTGDAKADAMEKLTGGGTVTIGEEEQLNEMAYDIIISQPDQLSKLQDKIKDSTKKGEQKLAKALEIIQRTKKEGNPIRQRDIANEMGLIQQEINPLINKLIDVGILEKGESVKKQKSEPKAKTEKTPKAEKAPKAVSEPTDDEEGPSAKDIAGDETAKQLANTPEDKKETFNRILGLVTKYKDDKAKIDAFITKAEKDYKLPVSMLKDLKRAAGRDVEA